jgi:hypothetical protein
MVLYRRWFRTDYVVRRCQVSCEAWPAAWQIFKYKWGSCRLGGIAWLYYVCLECSYDPQKAFLDSLRTYTLVIFIPSTSRTSMSTFSVCCYSRYLSQWLIPPPPVADCLVRYLSYAGQTSITYEDRKVNRTFHQKQRIFISLSNYIGGFHRKKTCLVRIAYWNRILLLFGLYYEETEIQTTNKFKKHTDIDHHCQRTIPNI